MSQWFLHRSGIFISVEFHPGLNDFHVLTMPTHALSSVIRMGGALLFRVTTLLPSFLTAPQFTPVYTVPWSTLLVFTCFTRATQSSIWVARPRMLSIILSHKSYVFASLINTGVANFLNFMGRPLESPNTIRRMIIFRINARCFFRNWISNQRYGSFRLHRV